MEIWIYGSVIKFFTEKLFSFQEKYQYAKALKFFFFALLHLTLLVLHLKGDPSLLCSIELSLPSFLPSSEVQRAVSAVCTMARKYSQKATKNFHS